MNFTGLAKNSNGECVVIVFAEETMNDCAGCSSPHGRKALEDLLEGWPGRLRAGCRRQSFPQSFDRYPAHSLDDKWRNRVRSSAKIIGDSPTRVVSRRLIVHFE